MSKRSVSTDALETLGTIITDKEKRDAIHLAVDPVIAGERLNPGEHITVKDGKAWRRAPDDGLGIVDPFLAAPVESGQRFWFVMYPRMVTSLRHVWSHPSFPDEVTTEPAVAAAKEASEAWLRDFCAKADCPGYEETISAAVRGGDSEWDEEYLHFDGQGAHGEIPPEFWDHVEIVTGRKAPRRAKYFSCSC